MEYLIENKHRYAARLLADDLIGNVYSAINQADKDLSSGGSPIFLDYHLYYMVYDEKWENPYIVKKMKSSSHDPYVNSDTNIKSYKW